MLFVQASFLPLSGISGDSLDVNDGVTLRLTRGKQFPYEDEVKLIFCNDCLVIPHYYSAVTQLDLPSQMVPGLHFIRTYLLQLISKPLLIHVGDM